MSYLFNFFIIFCFSFGVFVYFFYFLLLYKNASKLEVYFLSFITVFMLLVFFSTLLYYMDPVLVKEGWLNLSFQLLSRFFSVSMFLVSFLLIHELVNIKLTKARFLFFILGSLLFYVFVIGLFLYDFFHIPTFKLNIQNFELSDVIFGILEAYIILILVIYAKKITNKFIYGLVKSFVVLTLVLFPLSILTKLGVKIHLFFLNTEATFDFIAFPFYYLLFNILMLFFGLKYIKDLKISGKSLRITDSFISKYNITKREKELIELLTKGFSNKEVAYELSISPATVRNHITNIYEKTNASNRVELIRLCNK